LREHRPLAYVGLSLLKALALAIPRPLFRDPRPASPPAPGPPRPPVLQCRRYLGGPRSAVPRYLLCAPHARADHHRRRCGANRAAGRCGSEMQPAPTRCSVFIFPCDKRNARARSACEFRSPRPVFRTEPASKPLASRRVNRNVRFRARIQRRRQFGLPLGDIGNPRKSERPFFVPESCADFSQASAVRAASNARHSPLQPLRWKTLHASPKIRGAARGSSALDATEADLYPKLRA